MKYVIGTGWWCSGKGRNPWTYNSISASLFKVDFFERWWRSVDRNTSPMKIVAVDSASPFLPDFESRGIEVIHLVQNFGGAYGLQRSAATRQLFLGAWYALVNGADHFVWVEQDCLLHGRGIVERAICNMGNADYSMGSWNQPRGLETCFIIFKCSSIPRIWELFTSSQEALPELRYWAMKSQLNFVPLPFGYGRNRPIQWGDEQFFAQQMSDDELLHFSILGV